MTYGGDKDPVLLDMIARWVIAMPYVLKAHVTEAKDLTAQLEVWPGGFRACDLQFRGGCTWIEHSACLSMAPLLC